MTALEVGWQVPSQPLPLWGLPDLQPITGIEGLDPDVLDDNVAVALEPRPWRQQLRRRDWWIVRCCVWLRLADPGRLGGGSPPAAQFAFASGFVSGSAFSSIPLDLKVGLGFSPFSTAISLCNC